jgi:hypothetical protein
MPISRLLRLLVCIVATLITLCPPGPLNAQTFDCTNYSDFMHWLERVPVEPTPIGLTLVDDLAYVSSSSSGLMIFDISDPANPTWLGTADTPANCMSSLVIGDLAYVADAYSPGFCVIDVSDPTAPVLLGQTGGWNSYLYDLALAAPDTFYLADAYYGVRIVEASDPTAPTTVGSFNSYRAVWEVKVEGDLAFIPDDQGLRIFDITDTVTPGQIGFAAAPGFNYALARHGNHMIMASYDSLRVFDVTDPTDPILVGTHATRGATTRIRVVGDTAFLSQTVGQNIGSLELFDVSDPTAPFSLGGFGTLKPVYDAEVREGHAFVTVDQRGLLSLELNSLAIPDLPDTLGLILPRHVTSAGDLALVTSSIEGLTIVDFTATGIPMILGRADTPGDGFDAAVQGDHAYVADFSGGLRVISIADPTSPVEVGFLYPLGTVVGVAVQGDRAFLCGRGDGLRVVDISDPAAPSLVATLAMPDWALGVVVNGSVAYVACDDQGLQVVDISLPDSPVIVSSLPLEGKTSAPFLDGETLYVCGSEAGLHIVDVSLPEAPVLVSTLLTPGTVVEVAVASGVAYIADLSAGAQIADVSNPAAPFLVGTLDTPNRTAHSIALVEDIVCMTDWEGGFITADLDCRGISATPDFPPRSKLVLTAAPNPFNPGTSLKFNLLQPARVDLEIYDVGGRLVRTLLSGRPMGRGPGQVSWDGRDDRGRAVAAGIYLGRLTAGEMSAVGRMVIVK